MLRYQVYITQDGSPTLQWLREDGYGEKMHHSGGALSESLFIYQEALLKVIEQKWPLNILSLGLGLAYNEIIAIATLHKAGLSDWKIWSFELQDELREEFLKWATESHPSQLSEVYAQILSAIATRLEIPGAELKTWIRTALNEGKLELRAAFPDAAEGVKDCTCVFYDAFSKKMNPELWDEQSLKTNLEPRLFSRCVLSTYAATGSLNRALKALGFRLLPRVGFLGKRESTLAIRE